MANVSSVASGAVRLVQQLSLRIPRLALKIPCLPEENSLLGRVGNLACKTLNKKAKFDAKNAQRSVFAEIPC